MNPFSHNELLCGNFDLWRSFEQSIFFINYDIFVEAQLVGVNINKPISFVTVVVPCDHLFLDLRVYFGSFLI
jgi:hypothetical protein